MCDVGCCAALWGLWEPTHQSGSFTSGVQWAKSFHCVSWIEQNTPATLLPKIACCDLCSSGRYKSVTGDTKGCLRIARVVPGMRQMCERHRGVLSVLALVTGNLAGVRMRAQCGGVSGGYQCCRPTCGPDA